MKKTKIAVVALMSASLILAACGGDDEAADTTMAPVASEAPSTEMPAAGDIVAIAASNPDFETLVAAVGAAGLVETLQGDGPFTVFAPTDDAFAALPEGLVEKLLLPENKDTLVAILTYHVVAGQADPTAVVGEHTTVQGGALNVTGSGDALKVNDAGVVCGGIKTANATLYLIDTVLIPPAAPAQPTGSMSEMPMTSATPTP